MIKLVSEVFREGRELYEKGQFAEAVKCLERAASQQNARAQFYLGLCYEKGQGVPKKDLRKAAYWYRHAAEWNLPEAKEAMSRCYREGIGVNRDVSEAIRWEERAKDPHYRPYSWEAKEADLDSSQLERDAVGACMAGRYPEAVEGFRLLMEKDFSRYSTSIAQYHLGICYEKGEGVQQDYDEAMNMYRLAAENGKVDAETAAGSLCYELGDHDGAAQWFRSAAQKDNMEAQFRLGRCLCLGEGVSRDVGEGLKWLNAAASGGNEDAILYLASLYEEGELVPRDYSRAAECLRAVEHTPAGAFRLARFYLEGLGVPKDENKALDLFRGAYMYRYPGAEEAYYQLLEKMGGDKQKEQDDGLDVFRKEIPDLIKKANEGAADAAYELSIYYLSGKSEDCTQEEARKWAEVSIRNGHPLGKFILGELEWMDGRHEEGITWLKDAYEDLKDTEDPELKVSLGELCDDLALILVGTAPEEARSYARKGAECDYSHAKGTYGRFLFNGIGSGRRDPDLAMIYLREALREEVPEGAIYCAYAIMDKGPIPDDDALVVNELCTFALDGQGDQEKRGTACLALGIYYMIREKKYQTAFEWFGRGAGLGNQQSERYYEKLDLIP